MSDRKPWEKDYVTPAPSPTMSPQERGKLGGLAESKRRKEGKPKSPPRKAKAGRDVIPGSASQLKAAWETADNISIKRRQFLDGFIREYLVDFNSSMAYIRAGGNPNSASTAGPESLRSAYVQANLRKVADILEEDELLTRKEILLGLKREAHYEGFDSSHAARVRAWSQLSKIKGMEAPQKQEVTHRGGIMLVPMAPSLEAWEQCSTDGQAQLKNDVRK